MSEPIQAFSEGGRTKERSPNYPSLTLTQAVELAVRFYEKERRTIVAPEIAAKALGYGALSGSARTMIGSLRQYGLLESTKDGLRLSDLGMDIIMYPIGSAERTAALKEASMRPPLIRELYNTHLEASDDSLRAFLVNKRKFSPEAVGRFIPAFREAVQIARLPALDSKKTEQRGGGTPQASPPASAARGQSGARIAAETGETMEFVWQLSGDVVASMTVSKKIELDDVETLVANLEAAKRAILKQARANEAKPPTSNEVPADAP